MICKNGGRLVSNCLESKNGTLAARGFFSVFWRWSTVSCRAPRRAVSTSSIRTRATRILPQPSRRTFFPSLESTFEPSSASSSDNELPTNLRLLMRTLPHSVVVVTSSKAPFNSKESTLASYRGMTVSSFTTITLSPTPIISFNVKTPSETLTAIRESDKFLLHLLEANTSGARIADAFTKGSQSVARLLEGGVEGVEVTPMVFCEETGEGEEVEDLEEEDAAIMLPMLEAKGVRRVLACELMDEVEVGDHVVVIAEVQSLNPDVKVREAEGVGGLCYADGRYRRVGDVIDLGEDDAEGKGDNKKKDGRREAIRKIG